MTAGVILRAAAAAPFAMTLRQLALLLHLAQHGEQRVYAVAVSMNLTAPVISRAADVLAQAGLLQRRTLEKDRRAALLSLTEAGQAFAASVGEAP